MKKYLYFALALICLCLSIDSLEGSAPKHQTHQKITKTKLFQKKGMKNEGKPQLKPSSKKPIISPRAMTHIKDRHGPQAKNQNTSKFNKGYTDQKIQSLVKRVFQSDVAWKPSKSNPHTIVKDYTFKKPIGRGLGGKPVKQMRVVSDKQGNVITAFPRAQRV